jgi:hypothetical protein
MLARLSVDSGACRRAMPVPCARRERERDGNERSYSRLHARSNAHATKRVFNAHVPARTGTAVVAVYVYGTRSHLRRAKGRICPYGMARPYTV